MRELTAIVARSGAVTKGGVTTIVTKEALESITMTRYDSRAIPMHVEHDPFSFPMGKTVEIWVEPSGDEYVAVARMYIDDNPQKLTNVQSGDELALLEFNGIPQPFVKTQYDKDKKNQDIVSIDLSDFEYPSKYSSFEADVQVTDPDLACTRGVMRHSVDPVPLVQFVVSNPESLLLFWVVVESGKRLVQYTVDATLKKTADQVADILSGRLGRILRAYGKYRSKAKKTCVVQIIIPGDPEIVLLARILEGGDSPVISLEEITEEMHRYRDFTEKATNVTFARSEDGTWQLLHIKTLDGKVIGTIESYEQTMQAFEALGQGKEPQ